MNVKIKKRRPREIGERGSTRRGSGKKRQMTKDIGIEGRK